MIMAFTPRPVVSEKLVVKVEIELYKSTLTPQEAADAIQHAINRYGEGFSSFIVFLLRETRSSMYELKHMEIN